MQHRRGNNLPVMNGGGGRSGRLMSYPDHLRDGRPRAVGGQRGGVGQQRRLLTVRTSAGVSRPRILTADAVGTDYYTARIEGHNGAAAAASTTTTTAASHGKSTTRHGYPGQEAVIGVRILTQDRGGGLRRERIVQVAENRQKKVLPK